MRNLAIIMTDGYKTGHHLMYPENTSLVFSNFTPRGVKYMPEEAKDIVVFGVQYTLQRIVDLFDEHFFMSNRRESLKKEFSLDSELSTSMYKNALEEIKNEVMSSIKATLDSYTGSNYNVSHFEELWDLGYLPIKIRALEEGIVIKPGIPVLTYHNTTDRKFFWVTNFLETLISAELWKPMHSASMSFGAKKLVTKYALETDKNNIGATDFQNHDFSFRGMQSFESAIASGLGFITSSLGTDTLPVLSAADYYYDTPNAAHSVFATEHAVQSSLILTIQSSLDSLGEYEGFKISDYVVGE